MIYSFTIEGETPPKKNSKILTRTGRLIPSRKYTEWHEDAMKQIESQIRPRMPIENPVLIVLHFVHGDNIRRDSDNQASSVLDLLQDAEILEDDRWQIVRQIAISNRYNKGKPKVDIVIQEYQPDYMDYMSKD